MCDAGDDGGMTEAEGAMQRHQLSEQDERRPLYPPTVRLGKLAPAPKPRKPPASTPKTSNQKNPDQKTAASENLAHPLVNSEAAACAGAQEEDDTKGHHSRNISWELGVQSLDSDVHPPPGTAAESGVRHKRVPTKISLRQVLRHSPFETEADAYIQAALDEADAAATSHRPDIRTSILGNVPIDATKQAFEVDKPGNRSQSAHNLSTEPLPQHENVRHRKVKTAAQSLYELTIDFEELNRLEENGVGVGRVGGDEDDDSQTVGSETDDTSIEKNSLLKNASIIMRNEVKSFRRNNADGRVGNALGKIEGLEAQPVRGSVFRRSSWRKVTTSVPEGEEDEEQGSGDDNLDEGGDAAVNITADSISKPNTSSNLVGETVQTCKKQAVTEFKDFEDWLKFKRSSVLTHIKVVLFFIMIPATGIAAILFYLAGNPPCAYDICTGTSPISYIFNAFHQASASWWVLFVCCRQMITFSFARATNSVVIDYFALRTRWSVRIFGPFITLFIVQAGGWPFTLFFWSVYDFILLYGGSEFANHWMFYQDAIRMFNNSNPSGGITETGWYQTLLVLSAIISFVVAIKRFYLGLVQGKQTYIRFGEELARVMKRALMISRVGKLARDIETLQLRFENFDLKVASYDSADLSGGENEDMPQHSSGRHLLSGVTRGSKKARLNELLGAWEEPEVQASEQDNPDIGAIIQFRQSLSYLNTAVPFGPTFGPSSTRQECVESAEAVYDRLLLSTPNEDVLMFDVLATLTISNKGKLDDEMLMELIKLFRPDRDGILTILDFAKTCDSVYKEIKMLRLNVLNSSKLDKAFEKIINIVFYFILFMISVAALGVNPFLLLGSISTFIIGFAFMIAAACSHYVEGLLLILVRRPFEIGDRIHISDPNQDTANTGSPGWVVKDIDLFTTTVVLGATNEVATYANGSLASSRIINSARSHNAVISFLLKFPIYTPYSKLQIFKSATERFVKARPREWGNFFAFRCTRIEADLGFVEYIVLAQHREAWQKIGAVLQSRADLSSFALELSKKMDMRYVSPPMPIDLRFREGDVRVATAALGQEIAAQTESSSAMAQEEGSIGHVAQDVAAMFDTHLSP